MKPQHILTALLLGAAAAGVSAKEIQIQENSSGLSEAQSRQIAAAAKAMGAKEPLILRKSADGVSVSGTDATVCKIPLSADGKILNVSCK